MDAKTRQIRVRGLLEDFQGIEPLKRLLWSELGYDRRNDALSMRGWPDGASGVLAGEPTILASGADDGFEVIHCRLADRLLVTSERPVMEKLLSEGHDRALFVFSDHDLERWHFVNVRYGEGSSRPLLRRIAIGPEEEHRTASERIAMLDLEAIASGARKDPEDLSPLDIQSRHDKAFEVEPVTNEFFRKYREVFTRVEGLVQGIAERERGRLFTQRLFNRLMFLAFIQKKGWLRFDGNHDYLNALWRDYRRDEHGENFYRDRLKLLFFTGLNTPNEVDVRGINAGGYTRDLIGDVPYLNGGLFERNPDGTDDEDSVVSVPDEAIALILTDLFGRFNFTVTESTPLDIEVAVDPEMLGRVFEELVTGRHETGSYYTPKPIVSFMCREALKGHLGAELTDDPPETINAFVDGHDPEGLHDPEEALRALQNVTVCDPACGSGAYLLGMLHELLDLRASLFAARSLDARSTYARKLQIIQKNLYGVDVDPFAVNIARLRLWLSLVVDYDGDDDPPPLPNLDFKIEAGDSLIAPDPSGGLEMDMVRDDQVTRLEGLKADFLEAHGEEKKRLRREIESLRAEIAGWAHPSGAGATNGFDWQVEFAEIFAGKDGRGFDAVLANPPYVRQELIKALKPALKPVFPEVYTGTADLYVYFYARALQLLKDGGMLSFISSNKWFRANYGKNLRKHIADTCHVASITDFGDLPVFQSASAYPMIFAAQKGRNEIGGPTSFTQVKSLDAPYPDVDALIRSQGSPLPDDSITGPDWSLTDAATAARLGKMRTSGIPLGEYVKEQIYYGIKTGFNKAFVIDGTKREELISHDPKSAEIIKPLAVGRDIKKWAVAYKDKWLIYSPWHLDIEQYPAVKDHLQQWRHELLTRPECKAGRYNWWCMARYAPDYVDAFEEAKIIYPQILVKPNFAYDEAGTFTNQKCFIITSINKYLLGVLNSSAIWNLIVGNSPSLRGGYAEPRKDFMLSLPIPNAPAAEREAISGLVEKCLEAKGVGCEEFEREIDRRVAALYGL